MPDVIAMLMSTVGHEYYGRSLQDSRFILSETHGNILQEKIRTLT